MKQCVSCGKEIVDAAVNCLFCGSKQTPEAALKKTMVGFGTADVFKDKPPPLAAPLSSPPQATPALVGRRTPSGQRAVTPPPDRRTPTPTPIPRLPATDAPLHETHPFEPWTRSLRVVMIVFGLLLAGAAALPLTLEPLSFTWDFLVTGGARSFRNVLPVAVGAIGFLVLLVGILPLVPVGRAVVAVLVGGGLLAVRQSLLPDILDWRGMAYAFGTVLAGAGLLVRARYRGSLLGRILASAGAAAILAHLFVPQGSLILPIEAAKHIADDLGSAIFAVLMFADALLALAALVLVWLPGSGGGAMLAWPLMTIMQVGTIAMVLAGGAGDAIHRPGALLAPHLQMVAFFALSTYGMATLVGKACERPQAAT